MGGFLRQLDGSGAPISQVGGKAASLDRLVSFGFPVPEAVALTDDAYRAFADAPELTRLLRKLRADDVPPPDRIEAEIERVDRAFLQAPMPADLTDAIMKAAAPLLSRSLVAVRSSATAEDLASASFAGQYRSYLELSTEEQVLDAVRRCWASLWAPAVRAYRRNEGIAEDDLAMGVIIQAMAPADWAGVLFTRDPDGDADSARIEVVRGLGEALVSGQVTPHDFRVSRTTFAVRGSHQHWSAPFLEDLMRLGLRVERRLGAPQDIEWAYVGGEVRVLQTRPITVQGFRRLDDDGFDSAPASGATYTPIGIQEMLPGVLPPLLWSINAPLLDEAFRRLFAELGLDVPASSGPFLAIGRFRGRAALNLSVLREAAESMPGGSRAEVERQYLGRVLTQPGDEPAPKGRKLRRALAGLRALRIRKRVEGEVELFSEAAHGIVALSTPLHELPTQRLLAYRARVRDLAARGYTAEVSAAAGAAAAYRALEMTIARWTGEERAASWAQRITASPAPSDQAGVNLTATLWGLYGDGIRRDELCRAALVRGVAGRLDRGIRAIGEHGERLARMVHRVSRHFGSMAVFAGPTWDEDPETAWQRLRGIARCDDSAHNPSIENKLEIGTQVRRAAVDGLHDELRRTLKWKVTRVLTGQIVDARGRLLRKLSADATRFLSLRERAKASLLVIGGEERRVILEAARRLVRSGLLSDQDHVAFLSDAELEEMLLGAEPVSAEELSRRRIAYAAAVDADPLPETFEGTPGVEALPPIVGDVLEGWAASPGRVQGPARILRDLAEAAALEPGEVIVARTTDPSWTPLFLVAGAIVLEEGGPLSHAAIVARELGLPAVLNVKGATRAIQEGVLVEVDGDAGTVTRSGVAPSTERERGAA